MSPFAEIHEEDVESSSLAFSLNLTSRSIYFLLKSTAEMCGILQSQNISEEDTERLGVGLVQRMVLDRHNGSSIEISCATIEEIQVTNLVLCKVAERESRSNKRSPRDTTTDAYRHAWTTRWNS